MLVGRKRRQISDVQLLLFYELLSLTGNCSQSKNMPNWIRGHMCEINKEK